MGGCLGEEKPAGVMGQRLVVFRPQQGPGLTSSRLQ